MVVNDNETASTLLVDYSLGPSLGDHAATHCSQIHSRLLGDKVDSGIGLSYWPASLCKLTDRSVRQPYVIVKFIPPVRDYELGLWFGEERNTIQFT